MKVKIGPYRSFFGPHQLAKKLCFWVMPIEDEYGTERAPAWVREFGDWLAHGNKPKHEHYTMLYRFLLWVDNKKKRKVSVRIDRWDIWNMNETLAHIILPMLKQLKEKKHGAPNVDDKDVPKYLRSTSAPPRENEWDVDGHYFARWDWVINEMIFAFDSKVGEGKGWEEKFYSGEIDLIEVASDFDENGDPILSELKLGPNHTYEWDQKAHKRYEERIENGFRLFGKYYNSLWD